MNLYFRIFQILYPKNCRYKDGGPRKRMGTKKMWSNNEIGLKKMLVLKKCGYRKFWLKKLLKNWIPKHFLEVNSPET